MFRDESSKDMAIVTLDSVIQCHSVLFRMVSDFAAKLLDFNTEAGGDSFCIHLPDVPGLVVEAFLKRMYFDSRSVTSS